MRVRFPMFFYSYCEIQGKVYLMLHMEALILTCLLDCLLENLNPRPHSRVFFDGGLCKREMMHAGNRGKRAIFAPYSPSVLDCRRTMAYALTQVSCSLFGGSFLRFLAQIYI